MSFFFFVKQKTAYEMRISDWSSDVCSSDLILTTGNASFRIDAGSSSRTVTIGAGTTLSLSGAGTGTAFYTGAGGVSVASGTTMNNDANNYTGATRFNGATQASGNPRSAEQTSETQSLMRNSQYVIILK